MKIKVLKTTNAASCPLGIKTKEYLANETYEIFEELGNVFIKQGWGEEVNKINSSNDRLISLREEAKKLKIKGAHIMGEEKLIKAIAEKLEAEKALPKLNNKAITNLENK